LEDLGIWNTEKEETWHHVRKSRRIHRHNTGVYAEKKVSVAVKVKVIPWRACAGTEVRRGYRSNVYETRHWKCVVGTTIRPLDPQENGVTLLQEAGWSSAPVWKARKISLTGVRFPDLPAREKKNYIKELCGEHKSSPYLSFYLL
jgi:hypothetical protein